MEIFFNIYIFTNRSRGRLIELFTDMHLGVDRAFLALARESLR